MSQSSGYLTGENCFEKHTPIHQGQEEEDRDLDHYYKEKGPFQVKSPCGIARRVGDEGRRRRDERGHGRRIIKEVVGRDGDHGVGIRLQRRDLRSRGAAL